MVAMSPPQVMMGTWTGPEATAPTGVSTTRVSGGDWTYCTAAGANGAATDATSAPAAASNRLFFMILPGSGKPYGAHCRGNGPWRLDCLNSARFAPGLRHIRAARSCVRPIRHEDS